jgi:hypothetical protein
MTCQPMSAQQMVVWQPGMDHAYEDGMLWLKADSPGHAAVAVSVSADAQLIAAQLIVTNHSARAIDVLPVNFSATINQPHVLPLTSVPPESTHGLSALKSSTLASGQELRGSVYFHQEPSCLANECRGLLTVPVGEAVFVFPLTFGKTPAGGDSPPVVARASSPGPTMSVQRAPAPPRGKHDWQTGRVLDAATIKSSIETGSVTTSNSTTRGNSTDTYSQTVIQSMAIRDTQLMILSDEYAYVVNDTRAQGGSGGIPGAIVQAVANRHHGCRFIVGDDVSFYQQKATLHVVDVDSKECKAEVLRQERIRK